MDKVYKVSEVSNITRSLSSDSNLHFIYYERDLEQAFGKIDSYQKLEMAFKKGLLYSDKTIIITNELIAGENYGDGVDNAYRDFDFKGESEVSQSIKKLSDRYKEISNFTQKFFFLPSKMATHSRYTDSFYHVEESEVINYDFSKEYSNKLGINISFNNPNIRNHLFENYKTKNLNPGVMNIWLPQLKNIPMDTMLKLWKDEESTFKVYQYELKRILSKIGDIDTEMKLLELFQNVDENIRKIETKLKIIKKSSAFSKIDAVIGTTVLGLTFFLPEEITKMILSFLGSYNLYQFKDSIFKQKEKVNDFKSSEYYLPWLLHEKSIK